MILLIASPSAKHFCHHCHCLGVGLEGKTGGTNFIVEDLVIKIIMYKIDNSSQLVKLLITRMLLVNDIQ